MSENTIIPVDLSLLGPAAVAFRLRPLGLLQGAAATAAVARGIALPLAGSAIAFGFVELLAHDADDRILSSVAALPQLRAWATAGGAARVTAVEERLAGLSARRAPWAGFAFDGPLLMGIVNVTPDSFSGNGNLDDPDAAVAQGRALIAAGADILDIGGESTRPGATPVSPEEERRRIEPVIRALAAESAVISVDTRHAATMAAMLACGARIINDVSALADPESRALIARRQAAAVLMHMQGEPATMQQDPRYRLASLDIVEMLDERIALCEAAGISRAQLVIDPGIGFGKRREHNLEILARLSLLHGLGCGVLLGLSRKSLIGGVSGAPVAARLPGSLAGALHALGQGVQILRVHDVAETRQAAALARAIAAGA